MRRTIYHIASSLVREAALLLFMALVCLSMDSCMDSDSGDDGTRTVYFTVFLPQSIDHGMTRAISTNEDKVNTLAMIIFDANNQNIGNAFLDHPTPNEYGKFVTTINTHVATGCTFYALANITNAQMQLLYTKADADALVSKADLNASDLNEGYLFGKDKGDILENPTSGLNQFLANMGRIYSKLTINVDVDQTKEGIKDNLKIKKVVLHSIPDSTYITDSRLVTTGDASPITEGWTAEKDFPVTNDKSFTTTYYIYENMVGKNTAVTSAQDRVSSKAPAHATYVTIEADYETNGNVAQHAVYTIYIGGKNFSDSDPSSYADFNIYRNTHYNCNITLGTTGWNDARVELTNSASVGSWTGSVTGWTSNSGGDIDAPGN